MNCSGERPVTRALTLLLAHDGAAVSRARARVATFVRAALPAGDLADAVLLVSELVTNAILHADPGPIAVQATLSVRSLRVEVWDPGPGLPADWRRRTRRESGGWGLEVVAELSERWGFVRATRSCVWFEIDLADRPSA